MGAVASTGKNNDELIDNLVEHDSIKNERVERIMRLVDRGKFMPLDDVFKNAYNDSAWKSDTGDPGFLHISAPCIYANVLENLDLKKGMSFLNIGSGTGYLSTIAGFFLEENGINHGVELYENVVNFANERIALFQSSEEACVFEWCSPTYFVGNAFQIKEHLKYDRIYCGALVPESHRAYFCSFLKVNGSLIMPYGHSLQRITRKSEKVFTTRDISEVTFAHLIPVNLENSFSNKPVSLPQFEAESLQLICRKKIRQIIRQKLFLTQPVEVYSLCAEKLNKNYKNIRRPRSACSNRSFRVMPPTRLNPVVILERGDGGGHFLNSRTTLAVPVTQNNENNNRIAPGHAAQFRHLFALFARDRIRRHHAEAARRAADYAANVMDDISDDDSDDENNEERNGQQRRNNNERLERQRQQQQYYNGPKDDSYNFVFESEPNDDEEEEVEVDDDNFSIIPFGGVDDVDDNSDDETSSYINYISDNNDETSCVGAVVLPEENNLTLDDSLNNSSSNNDFHSLIMNNDKDKTEEDENNSDESFETARDNLDTFFNEKIEDIDKKINEINDLKFKDENFEIKKEEKNADFKKNKNFKNNGGSSNNNNKRSRITTSNSMEMPQSSKIKRRSSNSTQGIPSTSSSTSSSMIENFNIRTISPDDFVEPGIIEVKDNFKKIVKMNNKRIDNKQLSETPTKDISAAESSSNNNTFPCINENSNSKNGRKNKTKKNFNKRICNKKGCSSAEGNEEVEEEIDDEKEKLNETKAEEKNEKLYAFYKLFVKLIQSLPINAKMRKFLIYENE